jgi:hypothetical protein
MSTIRVRDFAPSPGGRFVSDGEFSGEWFRDEILVPALRTANSDSEPVVVILDGTSGYGSSFLEEAFGGLVRLRRVTPGTVRELLKIEANSPLYKPYKVLAEKYIAAAKPEIVAA